MWNLKVSLPIVLVISIVGCGTAYNYKDDATVYLDNIQLFPDAKSAVIDFCILSEDACHMHIVSLDDGHLIDTFKIPDTETWIDGYPTADGKSMVFVSVPKAGDDSANNSSIKIYHFDSKSFEELPVAHGKLKYPSMSAIGTKVIYQRCQPIDAKKRKRFDVCDIFEYDLKKGFELPITDYGFMVLSPPAFISSGSRYVFSGQYITHPRGSSVGRGISYDWFDKTNKEYSKKYVNNDIFSDWTFLYDIVPLFVDGDYSMAPMASYSSDAIVYLSQKTVPGVGYTYQISMYDSGSIIRLTNEYPAIFQFSFQADTVAYTYSSKRAGINSRPGPTELGVYDINTKVTRTVPIVYK